MIFAAVAVIAVVAAVYTPKLMNWGNGENGEYGDVSIQEANELIQQKTELVILDVRTVAEFDDSHIEGAINIPVDELPDRLDELSEDDELLVYCRTGNRSGAAVNILTDAGYTKIYHMHEGISVWIQQGHPVVQ
jgi:rhodanese-related sulfurtransferase